ncbi:hypothetical protein DL96DRAFT_1006790 [Flagelloscypha sp. PMI_526]|nr:hypothetical protein DL96DRAFT_1006790 [Flagelloscypha sp. PMI_526]
MKTTFTPVQAVFVALFCESFLYGVYTILCAFAVCIFWKGAALSRTWLGLLIRILTLFLYGISTAHLIVSLCEAYKRFTVTADPHISYNDIHAYPQLYAVSLILDVINCIIADIILTWRVWVLYNCSIKALVAPVFLLVFTIAMTAITVNELSKNLGTTAPLSVVFSPSVLPWTSYGLACSILVTNVLCTGLISWKVVLHHCSLKNAGLGHLASTYRWIALIVCESGALYLMIWILFIIFAAIGHPAIFVITYFVAQLTGIVPTLVVVLVSLKADSSSEHTRLTAAYCNNPPPLSTFITANIRSEEMDHIETEHTPEFELKVRIEKTTNTS